MVVVVVIWMMIVVMVVMWMMIVVMVVVETVTRMVTDMIKTPHTRSMIRIPGT